MIRGTVLFFVLTLAGCTTTHVLEEPDGSRPDSGAPDTGVVVHQPNVGSSQNVRVGASGGQIELDDFSLEVPADSLSTEETIRVEVLDDVAPPGFTSYSHGYRFGPDGLTFDRPVRVRIPFEGDPRLATIYWTRASGAGFVALPTTIDRGIAMAEVTHFSEGFVGTACQGDDCCGQGSSQLDLLFMVDNSNSMAEEQASLSAELNNMVTVLTTGDYDDDGIQDAPIVEDLHVGVISSDMGTGGFNVPTCNAGDGGFASGDDGVLRTRGNASIAGCSASYPSFLQFESGTTDAGDFARQTACLATLGTGGCGFEQQLEATLKALTPSSSSITFNNGTRGHADTQNDGFLRPSSVLGIVTLSDEEDCSATDPDIYNPASSRFPGDLNLRCFMYPSAVHPVERYVDGLLALRDDPSLVVYSLITGVPEDLVGGEFAGDYQAILDDSRMVERVDSTSTTPRLVPSCSVPGRGIAFPPRRLVTVAKELDERGASATVQSICQEDFSGAARAILDRVTARLSGACE